MADTKPSLTAAELRAIGERVTAETRLIDVVAVRQVVVDRARLCAALERLMETMLLCDGGNCWLFHPRRNEELYLSRDEAVDALLGQGGGK